MALCRRPLRARGVARSCRSGRRQDHPDRGLRRRGGVGAVGGRESARERLDGDWLAAVPPSSARVSSTQRVGRFARRSHPGNRGPTGGRALRDGGRGEGPGVRGGARVLAGNRRRPRGLGDGERR